MRRSRRNALCRALDRNRPAILAAIAIAFGLAPAQAFDMKEISPAPPTVGTDLPASHIAPQPSSVQPELLGEHQILTSGKIDFDKGTITLPLYQGAMKSGQTVWYVVLDTDDKGIAEALGINYAAKLTFADIGRAARRATLDGKSKLIFEAGTVDFSPKRGATPGDAPNFFPPKQFHPGSIGDKDYSPLVKITNAGGHIYNAPILAYDVSAEKLNQFCAGAPDYNLVHDKIARICPRDGTVTLLLTPGFAFGKPVLYLSTDTNAPLTATLEAATYAPGLEDIKGGGDDSLFSPVERIFNIVNGPTGKDNPQRQGLNSALSDDASALNVLGGIPSVTTGYSPLWDVTPAVWTKKAIELGYRSRVTDKFAILALAQRGWITGLDGKAFGTVGLIVNCPIVYRGL